MSAGAELLADDVRRRERERRRRGVAWNALSLAGHVVFFAALVLFTPVRDIVLPESKPRANPAADLSADRIQDIGESLSEVRIAELLRQVREMQATLREMDAIKESLSSDYDRFAEKNSRNMRRELESLVAEAESNQAKAAAAQSDVRREVADIVAVETGGRLAEKKVAEDLQRRADALREGSVEKANTAQANAVNALDRLQVKAEFAGFRKTSSAAETLRDAQMEAGRMQDSSQTEAVDVAIELLEVSPNAAFVERGRRETAEAKAKLAEAQRVQPEADARIASEEAEMKNAEAKRDAARQEKRWDEAKSAQRVADSHRKAMEAAKRESRTAQRRANDAHNRIKYWDEKLPGALKRQKELERAVAERTGRQLERLDRAAEAQRRVAGEIAALKAVLAADSPELEKLAKGDARTENPLVQESTAGLTMTEAYELAVRLEAAVTESFKDVKSAQTAIARRMSFAAAQKITDVARPERVSADRETVEAKVRTKDALDRQKAAQRRIVDESEAMSEATLAMLEEAREIVESGGKLEDRMAAMDAAAEYQVMIEKAAAEDSNNKAKDLAALMSGTPGEKSGAPVPPAPGAGSQELVPGNVLNVSGRGGVAAKWMYVNSWHVIGPFPNPNRVNLRRKFAPESVVDLDAVYAGKDGRQLRWRFCQAKNSRPPEPWMADWRAEVVPDGAEEYAIYYAYAEVDMDRECDRWVAIGSDDRSDVWLNDIPIWGSSNRLKQWSLAEDFRRVHFRKGRNRILVRIENGHWNLGWSLCISTGDAKD